MQMLRTSGRPVAVTLMALITGHLRFATERYWLRIGWVLLGMSWVKNITVRSSTGSTKKAVPSATLRKMIVPSDSSQ